MGRHGFLWSGEEVALGHGFGELPLNLLGGMFRSELGQEPVLYPPHLEVLVRSRGLTLFALLQNIEGAIEELLQQRALPVVPHIRPHRLHIRIRQQVQALEIFHRAHGVRQVRHRLFVLDIAAKSGAGKQEMMKHEKCQQLLLVHVEIHAPGHFQRHDASQLRMAAALAFADIVEQNSQDQDLRPFHLPGEL